MLAIKRGNMAIGKSVGLSCHTTYGSPVYFNDIPHLILARAAILHLFEQQV
jgi:hypothetical protein